MNAVSDTVTAAEAEAGAEQARATLVGTLNQLRENLRPANVADEVMSNARAGASALTDQLWDAARRNPLPALLIGAGAAMILGLGGRTAIGGRSPPRMPRAGSFDPIHAPAPLGTAEPLDPTRPTSAGDWSSRAPAKPGPTAPLSRGAGALDAANARLADAATRGAGAVRAAVTQARLRGDPMSSFPHSTQEVRGALGRIIDEQPLVLAAIGVAIGAAVGAAIPSTEAENRLMGDASHSLRDAARDAARQQVGQIQSAAQHAVEDIKQTVAERGLNADNLSGLAHDVGEHAKAAADEASHAPGPTT